MSIDTEAPTTRPRTAEVRPGRGRWVALAVVLALVLPALASTLVYRHTVASERSSTFRSVVQAQTATAFSALSQVGWKQVPADAAAMSDLVNLELVYPEPDRRITVSTPRMRLGSATQLLEVDAEMINYDLPGWVGDRSDFVSMLLFGTYTDDASGVGSDEGSCVIRLGSPDAPVLTEDVDLGNGLRAAPCTPEQLASIGAS